MSSVELQFEFEWLKRAINCSKWAISLQVGMRSLKTAGRETERGAEEAEEVRSNIGGFWNPGPTAPTHFIGEHRKPFLFPRIIVRYIYWRQSTDKGQI